MPPKRGDSEQSRQQLLSLTIAFRSLLMEKAVAGIPHTHTHTHTHTCTHVVFTSLTNTFLQVKIIIGRENLAMNTM